LDATDASDCPFWELLLKKKSPLVSLEKQESSEKQEESTSGHHHIKSHDIGPKPCRVAANLKTIICCSRPRAASVAAFRRQQAVVLLLPIEVGHLADPALSATLGHRNAVRYLLENESLLGVRRLRCLYRSPLLLRRRSLAENSSQNTPVLLLQIISKKVRLSAQINVMEAEWRGIKGDNATEVSIMAGIWNKARRKQMTGTDGAR
jgi:hypothetical protein